jgi:phospholipase C
MFASTHFGVFADLLYLIAGTTELTPTTFVVAAVGGGPWGCYAPPSERTMIFAGGRRLRPDGPYPCFNQFPTIANLFDNAGVSWKNYYDAPAPAGAGWSPFETIQYVYDGEDWQRDRSSPARNVLSDIADGNLASVAFVVSPHRESDSPGTRGGPAWVSTIVQAVRRSNYWANAAVLVLWDDEGDGLFYDNAPPPQLDFMGLGFRVPLIAVSRYAKRGYVSHTEYEFGSILKFIEQNWNLPYLGGAATDQRANSIADMFTFAR